MTRARSARSRPSAEDLLRKATLASTPRLRAKYATSGLARNGTDRTTQAMLLRQLYLAHMEAERFEEALSVSEQMVALDVMPDVARQDAARACLGLEWVDQAVEHLRIASRVGPASRRAFHLWTLGTTLCLAGRSREATGALRRAARWGTTDKPLYQAQLALARLRAGERVLGLQRFRERLADAPCGQGYGQFVLGELCFHLGEREAAIRHLEGFVRRTSGGRVALAVALRAEIARAREILTTLGPV
jgi:tetratricopeptide (TPR) repeat protein